MFSLSKIKFSFVVYYFVFFCLFFSLPIKVNAQAGSFVEGLDQQLGATSESSGLSEYDSDPRLVAASIVGFFLETLAVLFLVYIVYSGYLIMFSKGDKEKVQKGKSSLQTAVIGVVVVLSAYSIVKFVASSTWIAGKDPDETRFEAGVGWEAFDACSQGRGDPVSCGGR